MSIAPALSDLARVFARIGVLSFGGPAAQIALMHRELVELRPWLSEREFLSGLSFCMLLPGPEAMQLATYAGWRLGGVRGGLIAGGLFVAPGALVILALAALYTAYGDLPLVEALFLGIQAAVLSIVVQAVLRLANKALTGTGPRVIAVLAFLAMAAFAVPFPLVIAAAAAWGALSTRGPATSTPLPAARGTLTTVAAWGALWAAPILVLWAAGARFLTEIALFFSVLAVVTFGGAYAVLAYMAQAVVAGRGWLTTEQMIDGLGLAETTPGPLILVTEFVAFVAGHAQGGWALGLAAALVALWVTFVPCFLWIFAGAPYLGWVSGQPRLSGALTAITAAALGAILNLSLWFAVHVLFAEVGQVRLGPLTLLLPDPASFDLAALILAVLAAVLLFAARLSLPMTLALCAAAGAGLYVTGL